MQDQPFSYTNLINAIQLQLLNDPTPPAPNSQEYVSYANLIANLAIPAWENERGTLWQELWVDVPNDATISAGLTNIPLPSDFKFIGGGYVRLTYPSGTIRQFPIKKIEEIELNPQNTMPYFYVQGNIKSGFQLILGWTPKAGDAEIGATVSFRYYKFASVPTLDTSGTLTNGSDVPEMADPYFIVYKVAAQVAAATYNMNMYQVMEDKANYSLLNMRMANDMASNFMDDYVKDIDGLLGYGNSRANKMSSGFWVGGLN